MNYRSNEVPYPRDLIQPYCRSALYAPSVVAAAASAVRLKGTKVGNVGKAGRLLSRAPSRSRWSRRGLPSRPRSLFMCSSP